MTSDINRIQNNPRTTLFLLHKMNDIFDLQNINSVSETCVKKQKNSPPFSFHPIISTIAPLSILTNSPNIPPMVIIPHVADKYLEPAKPVKPVKSIKSIKSIKYVERLSYRDISKRRWQEKKLRRKLKQQAERNLSKKIRTLKRVEYLCRSNFAHSRTRYCGRFISKNDVCMKCKKFKYTCECCNGYDLSMIPDRYTKSTRSSESTE